MSLTNEANMFFGKVNNVKPFLNSMVLCEAAKKGGEVLSSEYAKSYSEMDESEKTKWRKFAFQVKYPNGDPKEHGMDENYNYADED